MEKIISLETLHFLATMYIKGSPLIFVEFQIRLIAFLTQITDWIDVWI